jgi:drug/metabolite transporter (DMT)-like permease
VTASRSPAAGTLLALASALAFSSLAVWGKLAQQLHLPTYTLLPWRFALVALVLFGSGAARGPFTRRDRWVMVANGGLYTLATTCYFLALARISAGATGLLLYLAPAFVVLYVWLLGRRPHGAQLVAVALTAIGLGLVVGLPGAGDRDVLGLGFGVLTGALYGAYLLFSERYLHYPPLAATAWLTFSSAIGFGVMGALTGTLGVPAGAAAWGVVAATALFPTLLAVPLLFMAIRRIGAARTSVLATTEPLWTVLLAFLVLDEPLRASTLAGGALILAGALLAQRAPPGEQKSEVEITPPAGL